MDRKNTQATARPSVRRDTPRKYKTAERRPERAAEPQPELEAERRSARQQEAERQPGQRVVREPGQRAGRKPTARKRVHQMQGHGAPARKRPAATATGEQKPEAQKSSGKRYIASIDGLRAFAVLAVILYHMGLPFARGGLLGVTVFFVISGYLITGLLTAEWESTGSINLPQFWLRRIRRLFPAIFTVIFTMAAVYTVFSPMLLAKMRPDIIPGLFWFENWWYIVRDLSYFDAVGVPSPLTHFWSLAIEEQFYLVWPIILLGVYKVGLNKTAVRRACLVLAVASALAMAVMYDPAGDPSRVYYGTDTRAFSLLIGAWLSFAWPGVQLTEESTRDVPERTVLVLDAVGVAAFLGIVAMCVFISGFSGFMYRGGLVLCSVLTAVVIAALAHPRSRFARVFALKPLVWIGQRSYGMYLWHFPIIELLQPRNATALPWWVYLVEVALTVVVSDLSYRFVETPLRRNGLKALTAPFGGSDKPTFGGWVRTHVPAAVASAAIVGVALFGIFFVAPTAEGGVDPGETRVMSASLKKPLVDGVNDVVFIGDSVSLGANEELNELFPHGLIDTEGNRQLYQGIEGFESYLEQGVVGDTVVFSLGTNGYVETEELDRIMSLAGPDRTVWFVNIRVPDERCEPNNQAIQACVDSHDNANLIDWYSASAGHDDWLIEDGIHLTWDGQVAFAQLVCDTIGYVPPSDENTRYDVTFMGDAVAIGAVDGLAGLFPQGLVDCSEGRSIAALEDAFMSYVDKGVVGDTVVFCTGNEFVIDRDSVESLVSAAGDRKVWLVNDRNAEMWCTTNNDVLAEVAAAHDNVEVIDWYGASTGHDGYLGENGMSLTGEGAEAFVGLVRESVGR